MTDLLAMFMTYAEMLIRLREVSINKPRPLWRSSGCPLLPVPHLLLRTREGASYALRVNPL
jgi:hypothetical protein